MPNNDLTIIIFQYSAAKKIILQITVDLTYQICQTSVASWSWKALEYACRYRYQLINNNTNKHESSQPWLHRQILANIQMWEFCRFSCSQYVFNVFARWHQSVRFNKLGVWGYMVSVGSWKL